MNKQRHAFWYYKNLFSAQEIKQINHQVRRNTLEKLKDDPAIGITKTAAVKIFRLGDVPLLKRFVEASMDSNQENFGFNLYPPQNSLCLNYNVYNSDRRGEYDWHFDSHLQNPASDIKLTCLLNLSEKPFEGGQFWLALSSPQEIIELSQPGSALIFPAFVMHKVVPVTKGERITVALWLNGPKFQ